MAAPAVFLFHASGCPACHQYMPVFQHGVQRLRGQVPIGVYDLEADRHGRRLAEKLGVRATPTTIVMSSRGTLVKREGLLDSRTLAGLLAAAQ